MGLPNGNVLGIREKCPISPERSHKIVYFKKKKAQKILVSQSIEKGSYVDFSIESPPRSLKSTKYDQNRVLWSLRSASCQK